MSTIRRRRFVPRPTEDYALPDLNPYLKLHREFGPPVLPAETALEFRDRWDECFGAARPLHLEIGSGNGFFLAGMSARHPDQNWLGIEIRFKRVILCAKKIQAAGVENARIARYDAWWLDDLFAPGSVAGLYVNHPDPWEKAHQEKHRLMGRHFAGLASRLLRIGAEFRLKTDHLVNVDSLCRAVEGLPLELVARVEDIAANGTPWDPADDIRTNYQSKFERRDEPVHAVLLRRIPGEAPPPPVSAGAETGAGDDGDPGPAGADD